MHTISVNDELHAVSKVIKHPRRMAILNIVYLGNDGMSARDIRTKYKGSLLPQYLYADLVLLAKIGLISRTFSEEKGYYLYYPRFKKILIDLELQTVELF
jgi:hypothetical protein